MKHYDRVYRDRSKLGIVVATSADGNADVFEGETVEVKWDGRSQTETVAVEALDRMEPVSYMTGTEADSQTTIAHITRGVLMSCGARDFVRDDSQGLLMFRVGPGRVLTKIIVKLMPSDLYAVERGHLDRATMAWMPDEQEFDVYADMLAETVLRLGDR